MRDNWAPHLVLRRRSAPMRMRLNLLHIELHIRGACLAHELRVGVLGALDHYLIERIFVGGGPIMCQILCVVIWILF